MNATGERKKKVRNENTLSKAEMQENLKALKDPCHHDFSLITKRH